jgi:transcriptional regulator with XRE-family HTH domain
MPKDNSLAKVMAERLIQVRERIGSKPYPFSLKAGIDSSQYNRAEDGKAILGAEKLLGLLTEYRVNLNWLIGGEGSMLIQDDRRHLLETPEAASIAASEENVIQEKLPTVVVLAETIAGMQKVQYVLMEFVLNQLSRGDEKMYGALQDVLGNMMAHGVGEQMTDKINGAGTLHNSKA